MRTSQNDAPRWALDSWWLDVKLGIRMLIKYPGLALAGGAGISVAVAITVGAFSVIYSAFLISSLPLTRVTALSRSRFGTQRQENPNSAACTITTSGAKA